MTLFLPTLSRPEFLFSFILPGFILTKIKVIPESADGVLSMPLGLSPAVLAIFSGLIG